MKNRVATAKMKNTNAKNVERAKDEIEDDKEEEKQKKHTPNTLIVTKKANNKEVQQNTQGNTRPITIFPRKTRSKSPPGPVVPNNQANPSNQSSRKNLSPTNSSNRLACFAKKK